MHRPLFTLFATFAFLVSIINAQQPNVIPIQVGQNGFFFDPPTTSALTGDIVSFIFAGSNHTVTQSSEDDPCSPLPGGFSSGLVAPFGAPVDSPVVWNLTITDDSSPIWFFCQNTEPQSHCNAGMVGSINPPTIDSYSSFLQEAKTESGTPAPTYTVVLEGVGALASATPSSPPITGTQGVTSLPSSPTSEAPPSTPSPTANGVGKINPTNGILLVFSAVILFASAASL